MAGSLNKVTLLGNLVRDPEVRQAPDGSKIVTLSVATSEQWRDKNTGERKEKAEFHRVVVFNDRLAGVAEQYLKKGRKAYFEGQLQTRKWTDQSGQDRYSTEVVLGRYRGELLLLDKAGDAGEMPSVTDPLAAPLAATGTHGSTTSSTTGSRTATTDKSANPTTQTDKTADDLSDFDDDIPF